MPEIARSESAAGVGTTVAVKDVSVAALWKKRTPPDVMMSSTLHVNRFPVPVCVPVLVVMSHVAKALLAGPLKRSKKGSE